MNTARLEARIPEELSRAAKAAAAEGGVSLTDFLVEALSDAVERSVERTRVIRLASEDSRAFASAILNPAPANDALARAKARHEAKFGVAE